MSESLYYEAIKNAFTRIMTDSEFSLSTPRVKLAKDCVGFLQTRLNEPDMTSFIDRLGSHLASIVDRFVSDGTGSNSTQRESLDLVLSFLINRTSRSVERTARQSASTACLP